jgi:hypothetical protein
MKLRGTTRKRRSEAGIALLISIFVLLLISVVAIALIVSSGTESALAGNYRNATGVYYAALAGLEEGRGRLLGKNLNSFKNTAPGFLPPPGATLPMGSPVYVINPVGGETVAPWDLSSGNAYADNEFNPEFASSGYSLPNPSPTTPSLSTVAGIQGPLYKWVRINAVSQKSLHLGANTTPLYYDGTNLNTTSTGAQVFEITSLAVLPNGSQKMLQYIAAPVPVILPNFPAALTIATSTNGATFTSPTSNGSYNVSGIDLTTVPFCTAGPAVDAIGVFDNSDVTNVTGGILPMGMRPQYTGKTSAPDVANVSGVFPLNLLKPSQMDNLAQTIIENSDLIITPSPPPPLGTAHQSDLPTTTSPTNPLTIVVNGNLDLTAWHHTGYGLLLVTGNLFYDPDVSWNGIILVIGQGTITGGNGGSGQINGAVLVAKTRDPGLNLLPDPNLGAASVVFNSNMGGNGIQYSSCWINNSLPTASYKILSFHEIAQ